MATLLSAVSGPAGTGKEGMFSWLLMMLLLLLLMMMMMMMMMVMLC